jgi:hypothetical protein
MQVNYNARLLKCKAWMKATQMDDNKVFLLFTEFKHGSKSAQESVRFKYFLSGKITDESTLDKFENFTKTL